MRRQRSELSRRLQSVSSLRAYPSAISAVIVVLACVRPAYASCPAEPTTQVYSDVWNTNQSATFALTNFSPCETLFVSLSATVNANIAPAAQVFLYGQTGTQLDFGQRVCPVSGACAVQVPTVGDTLGSPIRGAIGPKGLPASITLKVSGGVPKAGQAYFTYSLTIYRVPRPNYNTGGTTFGSAMALSGSPTLFGSFSPWGYSPYNEAQYFVIALAAGGTVQVSGEAEGAPSASSNLYVDVYDATQSLKQTIVGPSNFSRRRVFSSSVFTNTGQSQLFYLKVRAENGWLWDLEMTVATSQLTTTLTASTLTPTRGDQVTFTIVGAPAGAAISNWTYTPTNGSNPPISRGTATTLTWSGQLVDSGTASASVNGQTYTSQIVQVGARTGWATNPPAASTQLTGNSIDCSGGPKVLNDPPSPNDDLGGSCEHLVYTYGISASINDSGPNQGDRYVTSFSTTSTLYWYIISPPLQDQDPRPQFYMCKTGISPIIDVNVLIHGINRHEGGVQNSHFVDYVNAWSSTAGAYNYGVTAEAVVSELLSDSDFGLLKMGPAITAVQQNIADIMTQDGEPCAVNMNDTCTSVLGVVSYIDANGMCTVQ